MVELNQNYMAKLQANLTKNEIVELILKKTATKLKRLKVPELKTLYSKHFE